MDGERFVFIDETAATTAMTRRSGWSPKGERLVDAAPAGHWRTTTVVAGLRASGIIAPFVLSGPMTGEAFRAYVEQVLAPELEQGDAVVMDNLSTHKVPGVEEAIRAVGASVLYLPSLYGAFDVKLYFQALHRCRAPSFSRVVVSSCPETGSDGPHTSGGIGSGRALNGLRLIVTIEGKLARGRGVSRRNLVSGRSPWDRNHDAAMRIGGEAPRGGPNLLVGIEAMWGNGTPPPRIVIGHPSRTSDERPNPFHECAGSDRRT